MLQAKVEAGRAMRRTGCQSIKQGDQMLAIVSVGQGQPGVRCFGKPIRREAKQRLEIF